MSSVTMYEVNMYEQQKHWVDDADRYRCPACGFETSSPSQYDGCKCPKCGFQDNKDDICNQPDSNVTNTHESED